MNRHKVPADAPEITAPMLREILTLRYDTSLNAALPKLSWQDFTESNLDLKASDVERLMGEAYEQKIGAHPKTVGIALSSGIDSTLAAAVFRKRFPGVKMVALHVAFADSADESERAAGVADHLGMDLRIIHVDDFLAELPAMIGTVRRPFWDLHWYYVAREARGFSKYLINGNGGDEFFGGYTFRYQKFLAATGNSASPIQKVKTYLDCHIRDWVPDQQDIFGPKCAFRWDYIYGLLQPHFENRLSSLAQVFLADCNGKLAHNFAPLEVQLNNGFGIESVSPLMWPGIVRRATHMPDKQKYDYANNQGKVLLWRLLDELSCAQLVAPQKMGFTVNTANLWHSHAREICTRYMSDSRLVKAGWLNGGWIRRHINRDNLDVRYVNKFLGLLAFEIWYRMFETGEIGANERLS